MKTLYFMVVAFVMQNPTDLDRPLFVYYKPSFQTQSECWLYANKNYPTIYAKAIHQMGSHLVPEAIFCLTGQQVKDIHNYDATTKEKKQI